MFEEASEIIREAKAAGLVAVVWSYSRGADISKDGETAVDVTAYAAHIAALLGAHIIKVKPPTAHVEQPEAKKVYDSCKIPVATLAQRIAHVKQSCFAGKRIVIFYGGASKGEDDIFGEIREIYNGGGNGSIIGRNTFQRPRAEAIALLDKIIGIYKG